MIGENAGADNREQAQANKKMYKREGMVMNINLSFLDVTRIHVTDVEPELAQVRVKQNTDNRMMPHDEDFLV